MQEEDQMGKNNNRKQFYSRLVRKEEKRNMRRAVLWGLLTLILLFGLAFWGVPALIRVTLLLSDLRNSSRPIEQSDTTPPLSPKINFINEYTKEETLTVSGFSEASSVVELFLNDSPVGTTITSADGTFTFARITLNEGANSVYAIAADQAGNKSQPTSKVAINYDKTPPKLEVTEPLEGAIFTGERKRSVKVSGQTEDGVSLSLNDRIVILDQNAKFSPNFNLTEGENTLKFTATDQAGNQTEKEIKVTYVP